MRLFPTCLVVAVVATGLGTWAVGHPPCDARHYVLLFGGQADILRPTTAHVWATYVRATDGPDGVTCLEQTTISWLPVTGKVRPLNRHAEPGRNYTLEETLAYMAGPRQRVALWGPYEIAGCRYAEAVRQKEALDRGAARYKVNDWFDRRTDVEHCMHGLTRAHPDIHPGCRVVRGWGEVATSQVADAMAEAGVIADPDATHDWLIPALGLDSYELVRRKPRTQ